MVKREWVQMAGRAGGRAAGGDGGGGNEEEEESERAEARQGCLGPLCG